MKKLVFASHNPNKIKEIRALLPETYQLLTLEELNLVEEIPETENTFHGNALLKAQYVYDKFGLDVFADDSGLEVDALNGAPGVFSARYAGTGKSVDNIQKLLTELDGIDNRSARFITVIALIQQGKPYYFTGTVDGTITYDTMGAEGFGYDPVFLPDGDTRTFAQMPLEEKSRMSHRGRALEQLMTFLEKQ